MAGQVWSVNADGGFMYSDELSDLLRMELLNTVRFRQFCDADDCTDKGLSRGDQFHWNVFNKVAVRGGRIGETQKMPETKFTVTQGTGTIYEFGNSVPYTKLLDDLSKQDVEGVIRKVLKIDATETLETEAYNEFNATLLTASPTGGTSTSQVTIETTGTPTITNNVALSNDHVKAIVDEMKERDIPAFFDNGDYAAIGRPKTFRTFKNDLEAIHQYVDPGFNLIMNGEVGRHYEGVRFFEQTFVASENWTNAKSDAVFFFGADTVHEAIAIYEEIRGKIPGDFGRDRGIAWYALEGFKIVHGSDASQARILKWASAA